MEVRQIDSSEFYQLQKLHRELLKLITEFNDFQSTIILVQELLEKDSLAIGLFKDGKLVGYTLGFYNDNMKGFYYSGIFILPKYRFYTKLLVKESEKLLYELRKYKEWYTEANTKKGYRFLYHYGAKCIKNNLFKKEIEWEE